MKNGSSAVLFSKNNRIIIARLPEHLEQHYDNVNYINTISDDEQQSIFKIIKEHEHRTSVSQYNNNNKWPKN